MSPNKSTKIHMYIKILYNRAAYTLYIKAYIKYKNKDKRWCLPLHFEWLFFRSPPVCLLTVLLFLFFLDKWQYRRPMPKRLEKYRNATELGEENRCLKHEMDMNTKSFCSRDKSFACNRERERMGSAICTDSWCVFRVVLFLVNISRHVDWVVELFKCTLHIGTVFLQPEPAWNLRRNSSFSRGSRLPLSNRHFWLFWPTYSSFYNRKTSTTAARVTPAHGTAPTFSTALF